MYGWEPPDESAAAEFFANLARRQRAQMLEQQYYIFHNSTISCLYSELLMGPQTQSREIVQRVLETLSVDSTIYIATLSDNEEVLKNLSSESGRMEYVLEKQASAIQDPHNTGKCVVNGDPGLQGVHDETIRNILNLIDGKGI